VRGGAGPTGTSATPPTPNTPPPPDTPRASGARPRRTLAGRPPREPDTGRDPPAGPSPSSEGGGAGTHRIGTDASDG
jgi:hypothetical protein